VPLAFRPGARAHSRPCTGVRLVRLARDVFLFPLTAANRASGFRVRDPTRDSCPVGASVRPPASLSRKTLGAVAVSDSPVSYLRNVRKTARRTLAVPMVGPTRPPSCLSSLQRESAGPAVTPIPPQRVIVSFSLSRRSHQLQEGGSGGPASLPLQSFERTDVGRSSVCCGIPRRPRFEATPPLFRAFSAPIIQTFRFEYVRNAFCFSSSQYMYVLYVSNRSVTLLSAVAARCTRKSYVCRTLRCDNVRFTTFLSPLQLLCSAYCSCMHSACSAARISLLCEAIGKGKTQVLYCLPRVG
jgi:hypothetical protein